MRKLMTMLGLIVLIAVFAGCQSSTSKLDPGEEGLSAKEKARRAAALAHPGGPPYTYTWTETVIIDGQEYTKQGSALVVPE